MLVRVVKMTFRAEKLAEFKAIFKSAAPKIRAFPGCEFLELWQDKDHPQVMFTYSHWRNEEDLAHYRRSDLFRGTWARTKLLFAAKPQAWSVERLESFGEDVKE